jgi:glycerophosphoryl diester phosphodiesterase
MGLWPPNTLFAYERSIELGVDVLEMDIHMTTDGEIVIRHDPTVDATTNGNGAICDLTLSEIKALDAGYTWTADGGQTYPFRGKGITIPTLKEVLGDFPNIRLNIDIKTEDPAIVPKFAHILRDNNRLESVPGRGLPASGRSLPASGDLRCSASGNGAICARGSCP